MFSRAAQTDRSIALQSWKNYANGLELVYDVTNVVSFEQRFEIIQLAIWWKPLSLTYWFSWCLLWAVTAATRVATR